MARLLLVDDDTAGLELRKLILEREGHQVSAAADVVAARSLFLENRPDGVVLDLRSPDLEGKPEAQMVDELLSKPLRSARLVSALAAGPPRLPRL